MYQQTTTNNKKKQQFFAVSIEHLQDDYAAGLLTAKGALAYFFRVKLAPGWHRKFSPTEIREAFQKDGKPMPRSTFWKAIHQLQEEGIIDFEERSTIEISRPEDDDDDNTMTAMFSGGNPPSNSGGSAGGGSTGKGFGSSSGKGSSSKSKPKQKNFPNRPQNATASTIEDKCPQNETSVHNYGQASPTMNNESSKPASGTSFGSLADSLSSSHQHFYQGEEKTEKEEKETKSRKNHQGNSQQQYNQQQQGNQPTQSLCLANVSQTKLGDRPGGVQNQTHPDVLRDMQRREMEALDNPISASQFLSLKQKIRSPQVRKSGNSSRNMF
jgi:hypothetical protein